MVGNRKGIFHILLIIPLLGMFTITSCTDKKKQAKEELKLGLEFLYQSAPDKAMPHLDKAIELDPTLAEAYYHRANARVNLLDYDNALLDFNEAIAIDSVYMEAYYNRGNLYTIKGERLKACEDYKKAESLGKENIRDKVKFCP